MRKLYYSCGFGFRTLDVEEAKSYCKKKGFDIIQIYNDDLMYVGFLEYDKDNYCWHREYC